MRTRFSAGTGAVFIFVTCPPQTAKEVKDTLVAAAFLRRGQGTHSRCLTCARQVYVMPDPGLNGAAIGGDAIAEVCIRKPSGSVKRLTAQLSKSC
jgi:hypothetical protein